LLKRWKRNAVQHAKAALVANATAKNIA